MANKTVAFIIFTEMYVLTIHLCNCLIKNFRKMFRLVLKVKPYMLYIKLKIITKTCNQVGKFNLETANYNN